MRLNIVFLMGLISSELFPHQAMMAQSSAFVSEWRGCIREICGPEKELDTHYEILEKAAEIEKSWESIDPKIRELVDRFNDHFKSEASFQERGIKLVEESLKNIPSSSKLTSTEEAFFFFKLFMKGAELDSDGALKFKESGMQFLASPPLNLTASDARYVEARMKVIERNEFMNRFVDFLALGAMGFREKHGMTAIELSDHAKTKGSEALKIVAKLEQENQQFRSADIFESLQNFISGYQGDELLTDYQILYLFNLAFAVSVFRDLIESHTKTPLNISKINSMYSYERYGSTMREGLEKYRVSIDSPEEWAKHASVFNIAYNLGSVNDKNTSIEKEANIVWGDIQNLFRNKVSDITFNKVPKSRPVIETPPTKDQVYTKLSRDLEDAVKNLEVQKNLFKKNDKEKISYSRLTYILSFGRNLSAQSNEDTDTDTVIEEVSDFDEFSRFQAMTGAVKNFQGYSTVLLSYAVLEDEALRRGTIAHEFAHAFSERIINSERSKKSIEFWKNLRQGCLSDAHEKKALVNEGFASDGTAKFKEHRQTEEDFADLVSAKIHPEHLGNPYCDIIPQHNDVYMSNFQGASPVFDQASELEARHSFPVHRLLHVQSHLKAGLPDSCKTMVKKYKLERIVESQCL